MSNPSFLQGAGANAFNGTGVSVAFPSNTVAGDLLLVLVTSGVLNDVFTVGDGVNSWASVAYNGGLSGNTGAAQLWFATAKGGASTVSATTPGGSISRTILVGEWSANGNILTLDKFALAAAGFATNTSLTSGSVTTTSANELIIGAFGVQGNVATYTAGSPYTLEKSQSGSNGSTMFEDKLVSSAGANTASCTLTSTNGGSWSGIVTFSYAPSVQLSTTLLESPVPATVVNSSGYSWPITSPTLSGKMGQPTPICFCDANGNELTVTGSTKGAFIKGANPVVLCDAVGHPLAAPFVFTSNGNSITVSATPTGVKLGQPVPVVATDFNGFPYLLSGFTLGAMAGNPTPICLTDANGNVLSLSGIAT